MSKKRLRHCPALDKEITPAECGEHRVSRYPCPGDCAYNPFAVENYDGLAELEDRLDLKAVRRAQEDPLASGRIEALVRGAARNDELSFGPKFQWQLFHRKDKDGASLMDRWEKDGYAGLRNDERTLLEGQRQVRFALLETLEVRDDKRTVAVDLLRPEEGSFLIVDRGLASMACRFDRFASFLYRLPHYDRMRGVSFRLPEGMGKSPVEVLEALATHLGGSMAQEWLFLNMGRLNEAVAAVSRERFRRALQATDMVIAEANYQLKENWKTALGRLVAEDWLVDELSEEEEEEGYLKALLLPDAEASKGTGQSYRGTALLKPGQARLSAGGREALQEARSRFEAILGKQAQFESEQVRDVAKQAALGVSGVASELAPPCLVEEQSGMAMTSSRVPLDEEGVEATSEAFLRRYYESLLEEAIPQLGGLTPRAASADEAARPQLVEWVKGIVRDVDQRNLDTGREEDANWLVRELGLEELDVPPPPPGRVPAEPLDDEDDEDDEDWWDEDEQLEEGEDWFEDLEEAEDEDATALPFPHGRVEWPLRWKEDQGRMDFFSERIEAGLKEYETAEDALVAMEVSGCYLVDEMYLAVEGLVGEKAFGCGVVPLVMAWLAVVPQGRSAALEPDAASRELKKLFRDLENELLAKGSADASDRIIARCREPELLLLLWDRLVQINDALPGKRRVRNKEFFNLMLSMVVAVNLLVETQET